VKRTSSFGLEGWEDKMLQRCPPNGPDPPFVMEGDVWIAPTGRVVVALNSAADPLIRVWRSVDNGLTFSCLGALQQGPVIGGPVIPDRLFVIASTLSAGSYFSEISAGISTIGGNAGHTTWGSTLGGDTGAWVTLDPHVHVALTGPGSEIPLGHDTYLDTAKPLGQGFNAGTQMVTLSNGALYSPYDIAWTNDGIVWHRPLDFMSFPPFALTSLVSLPSTPLSFPVSDVQNGYAMWDASSAGVLFAVRERNTTAGWVIDYKWYDGSWHDGARTITLSDEPRWDPLEADESADYVAAVKSFGTKLGILTRDGTSDVLFQIQDATSPAPTVVTDVLGTSETSAHFPNLVYDRDGRAVALFQGKVAYALTP
jgi:hypothetical protein